MNRHISEKEAYICHISEVQIIALNRKFIIRKPSSEKSYICVETKINCLTELSHKRYLILLIERSCSQFVLCLTEEADRKSLAMESNISTTETDVYFCQKKKTECLLKLAARAISKQTNNLIIMFVFFLNPY